MTKLTSPTKLTPPTGLSRPAAERLLAELISIPSVNPAYDASSLGENALGDAVGVLCESFGCEVGTSEVVDGRRNTLVRLASETSRTTLLIEAHLDTVGLPGEATSAPEFDMSAPAVHGDRMYGRGACDVKGALAAALLAMGELAANPLTNLDVVLLGAIDEEYQFRGITAHIAKYITPAAAPDAAIVLEPTELQVVHEHHGVLRVEIRVIGRAAHTSRPHEGRNAILDALTTVGHLEAWNANSGGRILAVTTIMGGTAINIVPGECILGVDLRILPWEDPCEVLTELQEQLAALASDQVEALVATELILDGGMATAADAAIVQAAVRSAQVPTGPVRVTFGTDGSKLARAGVPTIVFGPGSIAQAHADDEWVELGDIVTAAERLVAIARDLDARAAGPAHSGGGP